VFITKQEGKGHRWVGRFEFLKVMLMKAKVFCVGCCASMASIPEDLTLKYDGYLVTFTQTILITEWLQRSSEEFLIHYKC